MCRTPPSGVCRFQLRAEACRGFARIGVRGAHPQFATQTGSPLLFPPTVVRIPGAKMPAVEKVGELGFKPGFPSSNPATSIPRPLQSLVDFDNLTLAGAAPVVRVPSTMPAIVAFHEYTSLARSRSSLAYKATALCKREHQ